MTRRSARNSITLTFVVLAAGAAFGAAAARSVTGAAPPAVRPGQVVVLSGAELSPFAGATGAELWAWAWRDDAWSRLPAQLDERDAAAAYVTREDGVLDENDEFVLPLDAMGSRAPEGAWPPGMERRLGWLEVHLTDPSDPALDVYAYVILSRGGPEDAVAPLITFDPATDEVHTGAYVLGIADPTVDPFVGFERLSLAGATENLLDRLKIRMTMTAFGMRQNLDEEDLAAIAPLLGIDIGGFAADPVIVGPVRVVFDGTGAVMAEPGAFKVDFASFTGLGDAFPGIQFGAMRVSMDFAAAAVGGTYRDANLPAAVPIDGQPDVVPETPLPGWREITLPNGRLINVSPPGGEDAATVYYKDDGAPDADDTGDGRSYADNGVAAESMTAFAASGYPGWIVVLPADSAIGAAEVAEAMGRGFTITVTPGAMPATETPGEPTTAPGSLTPPPGTSATPTGPGATDTPPGPGATETPPGPGATDTQTPTGGPTDTWRTPTIPASGNPSIFLPWVGDRA